MPRYTVELRRTTVTTRTATVDVEAPDEDAVRDNRWEDDWEDWEEIDATDSCDEIELTEVALDPCPSGEPDVDLTPL